jgi:hypothetical protein
MDGTCIARCGPAHSWGGWCSTADRHEGDEDYGAVGWPTLPEESRHRSKRSALMGLIIDSIEGSEDPVGIPGFL